MGRPSLCSSTLRPRHGVSTATRWFCLCEKGTRSPLPESRLTTPTTSSSWERLLRTPGSPCGLCVWGWKASAGEASRALGSGPAPLEVRPASHAPVTGLLCVLNTVSVRRSPHGESTPLSLPCSTATAVAREHGSRGDRRGPTKLAPHGPKAKCRARGRVSPALGHRPPAAGSASPAPNSLVYKVGTVVPRCAASPLTILVTGGQPCSRTTKWKIPEISSS